jgi:hypothetical protein
VQWEFDLQEKPPQLRYTVTFSAQELKVIKERRLENRLIYDWAPKNFHEDHDFEINKARGQIDSSKARQLEYLSDAKKRPYGSAFLLIRTLVFGITNRRLELDGGWKTGSAS